MSLPPTAIDADEAKDRLAEKGIRVFECISNTVFIVNTDFGMYTQRYTLIKRNSKDGKHPARQIDRDMCIVAAYLEEMHRVNLRKIGFGSAKDAYRKRVFDAAMKVLELDNLTSLK